MQTIVEGLCVKKQNQMTSLGFNHDTAIKQLKELKQIFKSFDFGLLVRIYFATVCNHATVTSGTY